MKLVADENIPLVEDLFDDFGEITRLAGRDINALDVRDADVLLVRSVTQVNRNLLTGSSVKFVGTCTIGTDHLDQNYLRSAGITCASAPGCNAWGVVQYDLAAMAYLGLLEKRLKVGVVGCGNVGGRLYRVLKSLGVNCVCYDPFLQQSEIPDLAEWSSLFDCDVVCVHTPLTHSGSHPTYHMIGTEFFSAMKTGALLLNAGRGEVVDNEALKNWLAGNNQNQLRAVLDVWESEPNINAALLPWVSLATPHIAGYSFEGKTNGSLMIYEALAEFLHVPLPTIQEKVQAVKKRAYGERETLEANSLSEAILRTYAIARDDANLRQAVSALPASFDTLRKTYPVRREFSHYQLEGSLNNQYTSLGFDSETH